MYTVLWIDDEHENFLGFKKKAYGLGLNLTKSSFDNYEEGLDWLKRNLQNCAAVILDVHCKATKDAAANVNGFSENFWKILPLCNENDIPFFVMTAGSSQSEEFSQIEKYVLKFKSELASKIYYTKNADEEILFNDIKRAISSKLSNQLKEKYGDILSFVGDSESEKLLRVMISIAEGDTRNTSCMNEMRQVLEWLKNYLIDYGLLPEDCKLSYASNCIAEYSKYGLEEIPRYIGMTLRTCENTTQEGSHDGTNDGIQVTKDLEAGNAPYLIESTLNNLLTTLHWAMLLPKEDGQREDLLDYLSDLSSNPDCEDCTKGGVVEERNGVYYVDNCKLNGDRYRLQNIEGKYVEIKSSGKNKYYSKDGYLYFSTDYRIIDDYE